MKQQAERALEDGQRHREAIRRRSGRRRPHRSRRRSAACPQLASSAAFSAAWSWRIGLGRLPADEGPGAWLAPRAHGHLGRDRLVVEVEVEWIAPRARAGAGQPAQGRPARPPRAGRRRPGARGACRCPLPASCSSAAASRSRSSLSGGEQPMRRRRGAWRRSATGISPKRSHADGGRTRSTSASLRRDRREPHVGDELPDPMSPSISASDRRGQPEAASRSGPFPGR